MMHVVKLAAVVLGGALALAACGADEVSETVVDAVDVSGADIDIDSESGSFTINDGDAQGSMGTDLDTPDWLPEGFPLPDDLSIQLAVSEGGVMTLAGTSSADADGTRGALASWFEQEGYEVIIDTSDAEQVRVSAVNQDGEVVDVVMRSGGFELEMSHRDVSFDRQDGAERIETAGEATIVVGDQNYSVDGTCFIQGADYYFEHFATDGSITATLQIYAVNDPAQVTAFIMSIGDDGSIQQYSLNAPSGQGSEPQVDAAVSSFGISGSFADLATAAAVDGSMSVSCEG